MDAEALALRVSAEFKEMPGLRLTPAQATRLWAMEPGVCEQVIALLVGSRFLRRTESGEIMRADQ
jgi:hypothetical protein